MRPVASANRAVVQAAPAHDQVGQPGAAFRDDPAAVARSVEAGQPAITQGAMPVATCALEDVVVWMNGLVGDASGRMLAAIEHGDHVALMTPQVHGAVGPILKARADAARVMVSDVGSDQPGVEMGALRPARGHGLRPVRCGDVTGLQDRCRHPIRQASFAKKSGGDPRGRTLVAGDKRVGVEQAIVADATGVGVAKRGMMGYSVAPGAPIHEAAKLSNPERLLQPSGIVDYVVGAKPRLAILMLGINEHPCQGRHLDSYTPRYRLNCCFDPCSSRRHFEAPTTIARAVLFIDAAIAGPLGEVVTHAKRDLAAGETVGALGGHMVRRKAEIEVTTRARDLPPIAAPTGARVARAIPEEAAPTHAPVASPEGRMVDRPRAAQAARFGLARLA